MKTNIVLLLMCLGLFLTKSVNAQKKQPNVLWILTDDQRYDAIPAFNKMLHGRAESALGYVESPNVDKLTEMGTTFINTFCQAQGCAPSRASMHSGRYPFRSGIYQFEYFNNNTDNSYPMLPEEMSKLGYQTFHIGKLGVRIRTLKDGKPSNYDLYETDVSFKLLATDMIPEWGKYPLLREIEGIKLKKPIRNVVYLKDADGKVYYQSKQLEEENPQFAGMAQEAYDRYGLFFKYNNEKGQPLTPFNSGILAGESPQPAGKTRDGNYTEGFIKFLKSENEKFKMGSKSFDGVDTSRPLFAHIGYDFPHTPVLPPKEYKDRFAKYDYKIPELTDEEFKKMAKAFQKRVKRSYSDNFTDEQKQLMVRDYYAFCAYGDALVGKAVDEFISYSENKKQEWMIVYVCGDHGWKLNEHGSIAKNTPWEMDSHNPIVVVSSDKKKFPAGKVVRDFAEFVDIAPTILTAGGADISNDQFNHLDGLDLQKVGSGKAVSRDYVIGESHHSIGPRAYIRTKDYMFSVKTRPNSKRGLNMNWAMSASYEELDPALYHTTVDPNEINNVAFDSKYEDIAMEMKKKLLDIVIGDGRAEINWGGDNFGKNTKAIGTEVHRNNTKPGAHDYKLKL
ncbi:sulfatase-like hydrolase/transferase [Reichenbachiella versicolor]|uniref:sulfatase-like hydrolase/transferase n=1 Tax=Reichenbachiella versicolor TaxID=1821036 RepID=UPI000D6DD16E|nr:sulfatase-like hydrolase/transferase [Reichenbachiella versicolor]